MHVNGKFTDIYSYVKKLFILAMLMGLGATEAWTQEPVVITTDTDNSGAIEDGEKKLYLIQTNAFQSFYIAPQSNNTITTNNILGDDMLWYFLDAGTDNGTQYYYIVNNSNGKYICHGGGTANNDTSRGVTLVEKTSSNDERCKFYLNVDNENGTTGFYNIDAKGKPSFYGLNKRNGSETNQYPIRLTNDQYIHDSNSKWKFIPFNGSFTWPAPPFTVSTDLDKHYYEFRNFEKNTFYASTDETPDKVTFTNQASERRVWYFKEASSDSWYQYYYIIHPSTGGKYMYYSGTATNGSNQTNAVSVKAYDSNDEDRYLFVVVQAARGNWDVDKNTDSRKVCYAIIPKLLIDKIWSSNSLGLDKASIDDGVNMGIISSRGSSNGAHWIFNPTDFNTECDDPVITFSNTTGKVTISTATSWPSIYYTTDGTTEPSSTNGSTLYEGPFNLTEETTIKAIVTKGGYTDSEVTTKTIYKVATPTIQENESHAISITCATTGATIYYTTGDEEPSVSSTEYTAPLGEEFSGRAIKAIAVKNGSINSAVASETITMKCAKPAFTVTTSGENRILTISCAFPSTAKIYYTTNGDTPTSSSSEYSGAFPVTTGNVIKAIAIAEGFTSSDVVTKTIREELTPTDNKYLINDQDDFDTFIDMASNDEGGATYHYVLKADVNAGSEITIPFSGTFDGQGHTISGLSHALFNSIDGGTVKNVNLDGVNITSGTNVGAIANETSGASRIYNIGILDGSVGGNGKVGGIVGLLDGTSRVINCYSYATITGGNDVGGIVGYNNGTTTAGNINTMVMNCMFYGDITGGTTVSPVYGGNIINNLSSNGLNTFNYYAYEKLKTKAIPDDKYNCALAVKDDYLNRFEFYRLLLNSNKKLAALYASTSTTTVQPGDMAKWVLETADRTIDAPKPYPVLKEQGYYPSIINYDTRNLANYTEEKRNQGLKTGELTVNISIGSGYPTDAVIKDGKSQITLIRTDKDFEHYNYNYDKVQLPYYNDVGDGNYTENKVVTGWKITAMGPAPEEADPYTASNYPTTGVRDFPDHNYADRKSRNKDLYSVSKRVFSQGAYFDVPYGVTSITIEPYWGNAAYIADPYYDVTYNTSYGDRKDQLDAQATNKSTTYPGLGGQKVYTNVGDALGTLSGSTVYDNAIVLVGNLHLNGVPSGGDKAFTMMSVDWDNDNEPDYSMIYHHSGRTVISPIRFDFLNIPGTAQAQKPKDTGTFLNFTIFKTKGWFETTNTCLVYSNQVEYENKDNVGTKKDAPLILLGGDFEQFVSTQTSTVDGKTIYVHVGSNVRIQSFGLGTHGDGSNSTPHVPVSVTGGEFEGFYLSGTYNQDVVAKTDNAECYISGGHFVEAAGASQEQIDGSVHWQIYDADMDAFYGGGVNAAKPITGDITVDIFNSHVKLYCGGPKFGNMAGVDTPEIKTDDKKVTTNATGCTFDKFFGAGFGGTSYSRKKYYDVSNPNDNSWSTWAGKFTSDKGKYFDGETTGSSYVNGKDYGKKGIGVATDVDYEFFAWSGGQTGGRFYVHFASFSLAACNDVESNLKDCIINENFYGAGSYGEVKGTATSELDGCTVHGNVFGGGYSATLPTVKVRKTPVFSTNPNINKYSGMFEPGVLADYEESEYEWKNASDYGVTLTDNQIGYDKTNHYLYTTVDLTALGKVGSTDLTVKGNTLVEGKIFNADGTVKETTGGVFGGGDESAVNHNTEVKIQATAAGGVLNVFGGGNKADVVESTTVTITGGTIGSSAEASDTNGNVYGGGKGETTVVGGNVTVNLGTKTGTAPSFTYTGTGLVKHNLYGGSALGAVNTTPNASSIYDKTTTVNIFSGTVNGSVFGGGLGHDDEDNAKDIVANNHGNTTVTVENSNNENVKVLTAIYGGANENGVVKGNTTVMIMGGTVGTMPTDSNPITNVVFGGGLGQPTLVHGNVLVSIGTSGQAGGGATINGHVYGGGALGNVNTSKPASDLVFDATKKVDINLYKGTINGDVYGGGLGDAETPAYVGGDVNVLLDGAKIPGSIFGCNNVNGTPKGHVKVHVKQTVNVDNEKNALKNNSETPLSNRTTYDVAAVYGGGNQADYNPTDANIILPNENAEDYVEKLAKLNAAFAEVLIEGCNATSINNVYGGGNAAAVPATDVTVEGAYIINTIYGGGNGESTPSFTNPGANVGIINAAAYDADESNPKTAGIYGTGNAITRLKGGCINSVYGGSNTKGNIRGNVSVERRNGQFNTSCELKVGNVYGAGHNADMDGNVNIILECMPEEYVTEVFGGAENAVVNGNVSLTVTSGKFGRVFGGNNTGGSINGSITVIAKEEGCKPLEIGELFGGGNVAPYSQYGCTYNESTKKWEANPTTGTNYVTGDYAIEVLVEACTSIGKIFGGGRQAEVTGNTHVFVNMFRGMLENESGFRDIGKIGQIFGGGDQARVIGNTKIDIGTDGETTKLDGTIDEGQKKGVVITKGTYTSSTAGTYISPTVNMYIDFEESGIYGGGNQADVEGDATLNIGTAHQTLGININGDIFGGGYGETTHVTGNVTVNIGDNIGTNEAPNYVGYAQITGDIYGGSAKGKVNSHLVSSVETVTTGKETHVNFFGGTLSGTDKGNIFGGGLGVTDSYAADVFGPVTVTMGSGTVNNVFGCNNYNGTPKNTVTVNINGGTVNHNVYGGGNQAAYTPTESSINYPVVNINNGTVTENVFGGGLGLTATVTANPHITIGDNVEGHTATILKSVYGGGSLASVDGSTNIVVNSGTIGTEGEGGATYGNIYGGGFGSNDNVRIGLVKGNTEITVNSGSVLHNIYGGGAYGSVGTYTYASDAANAAINGHTDNTGKATITILGGTIGTNGHENGMVFGASRGDIAAPGAIQDNMAWVYDTEVVIGQTNDATVGPQIRGSVYGSGENGHTYHDASVTIHSGKVGITEDLDSDPVGQKGAYYPYRGNVYGGGCGTDKYYSGTIPDGHTEHDGHGDKYNIKAGIVGRNATVTIDGGHVVRNVYGGGAMGSVTGGTQVNISGNSVIGAENSGGGYVYAASRGYDDMEAGFATVGGTTLNISGGTVWGSAFGGGQLGTVKGSVAVNVSGGVVKNDVYGGGALANTNTDNWNTTGSAIEYVAVDPSTLAPTYSIKEIPVGQSVEGYYTYNSSTSTYVAAHGNAVAGITYYQHVADASVGGYYTRSGSEPNYVYTLVPNGSAAGGTTYYKKKVVGDWKASHPHTTTVVLTGGVIGNAYGGGLGSSSVAANVYGDVKVTVNKPEEMSSTGGSGIAFTRNTETVTYGEGDKRKEYIIPVTGRVFGCNNINGTPTGNVEVEVYATRQIEINGPDNYTLYPITGEGSEHSPNGHNKYYEVQAVYGGGNLSDYLPASGKATSVYIGECDVTSIEKVYGGGNSAVVPSSKVVINGSFDIGTAFGGGNGGDLVQKDGVWYENDGAIVIGTALMKPKGGKVGEIFGGSDAKGYCGNPIIDKTEHNDDCPLVVTRMYGAGKESDVDHVDIIISGCTTGNTEIEYVFGGSYNAHIAHDINLTITAGVFKNVFGGNDRTGSIGGNITVNIEETENCAKPLIIQNLFGGGNEAAYPGTKRDGTEIITPGNITVNVKSATRIDNVFGGSFKADVNGNTEVNINMTKGFWANKTYDGKLIPNSVGVIGNIYGGGNQGVVRGNSTVNIATATTVGYVTEPEHLRPNPAEALPKTDGLYVVPVTGARITGDVFGGGSEANVNGNATVNICTANYAGVAGFQGVAISKGSVYGGGSAGDVLGNTSVTMSGGYVYDGVYGGGLKGSVGTAAVDGEGNVLPGAIVYHTGTEAHAGTCIGKIVNYKAGTGKCTVVVNGGQVGPVETALATGGMKNTGHLLGIDGPVDVGFVFGAGRGDVEDPATSPDADFHTFVKETDVTIGGTAFIMASVYGGGENGRVAGDTHVTIEGDCQIGCGEGQVTGNGTAESPYVPQRYNWADEDPAKYTECASWDYTSPFLPHDPYAAAGDAEDAKVGTDGHTYYGSVFGGGSGYYPYKKADGTHEWLRSAGAVYGNTVIDITGGHILTCVYGGNETTDVGTYSNNTKGQPLVHESGGKCTINMVGGTLGVPRTDKDAQDHPVTCYLFGAGKGDQRTRFNTWTNVQETEVNVSGTARIFGSVFGGGEDGHILGDAQVNIGGSVTIGETTYTAQSGLKIGTTGTSYVDGNVFGGGRGFSGLALTAGSTGGNAEVNIAGGTMLGSIYGGGRLASVGIDFTPPTDPLYGQLVDDNTNTHGHISINISGGTIGNDVANAKYGGNVFGGSMGRITLLNGTLNPIWPKQAVTKDTEITITGNALIKRNVYGGSEYGIVRDKAIVNIGGTRDKSTGVVTASGTPEIHGSVFGAGYGSDDMTPTYITAGDYAPGADYVFTPMIWTGCVAGDTEVNIAGGTVKKNVYGGGEVASVGLINCHVVEDANGDITIKDEHNVEKKYRYTNLTKHADIQGSGADEKAYGFALSWPYKFEFISGNPREPENIGGKATVNITGGHIGSTTWDDRTGYVFGGSKGQVAFKKKVKNNLGVLVDEDITDIHEQRYAEGLCANVRETEVNVKYSSTPSDKTPSNIGAEENCIMGAVYGGGEDGHVYENAAVNITNGLIGLSVYGGGKGEGTYTGTKYVYNESTKTWTWTENVEDMPSWTAGKIYGNTSITMSDGHVMGNVYGGGNLGSVGKGNYAGGTDDYYPAGYGETLKSDPLWTKNEGFDPDAPITNSNKPTTMADYFLSSGKCTISITGGTVGTLNGLYGYVYGTSNGTPTGMVFGGSRGRAARDVGALSPRYNYAPDFFLGYVNNTKVTIGTRDAETGPTIYSQVFGGGRDGHVRGSTEVEINSGTIGQTYAQSEAYSDASLRDYQRYHRGNVYGSGSGLGTWDGTHHGTSSGSVARNTTVNIYGGTIYNNVYGGGAMATVGPPKITKPDYAPADWSKCTVNIYGGTIGNTTVYDTHKYGGTVYGGSRGDRGGDYHDLAEGETIENYATVLWTEVNINGGSIAGNVYGGARGGQIKKDTKVNLKGGRIYHNAYGGGRGTTAIAADVLGNTTTELNKGVADNAKGCIVEKVFGCNDQNGTPKGHTLVHVYATQHKDKERINDKYAKFKSMEGGYTVSNYTDLKKLATTVGLTSTEISAYETAISGAVGTDAQKVAINNYIEAIADKKYDVLGVYGGGDLAMYEPTDPNENTEVIIDGCDVTSIEQVYGGGNAASTPANMVRIYAAYEIHEAFGGGNGKDVYEKDGKWYENPGANVGYKATYQHNTSDPAKGTSQGNPYPAVANDDADTPEERRANTSYHYGKGTANLIITGGRVHTTYGGSNTRGNVRAEVHTSTEDAGVCTMLIDKSYPAGKNADTDAGSKVEAKCVDYQAAIYGGAEAANVYSDVVIDITNGTYGAIYGGNDTSGQIYGSVTINVHEEGCKPIVIGKLYAGGYNADYSIYGYYQDAEDGNKWKARTKAQYDQLSEVEKAKITVQRDPQINIISATRIGKIYGGGYQAKLIGNPSVNVNMEKGFIATKYASDTKFEPGKHSVTEHDMDCSYEVEKREDGKAILAIGTIGTIYGGGYKGDVQGDTRVEIGTGEWLNFTSKRETTDADGKVYTYNSETNKWDWTKTVDETTTSGTVDDKPIPARNAATILGNVFGGGEGEAKESGDRAFFCDAAMVGVVDSGEGSTSVTIANGTVGTLEAGNLVEGTGNVYGGGKIGRVEKNTVVTIGEAPVEGRTDYNAKFSPIIRGSVFGAGQGVQTHGYSGLVRGNSTVTIQGVAKVGGSVYGGGEKATIGRYWINDGTTETDKPAVPSGTPMGYPYATRSGGKCTVDIKDDAEIGPDNMTMTKVGGPDNTGHVFGASQGATPGVYSTAKHMTKDNVMVGFDSKTAYLEFIETLALATETEVTIGGNAFVKGDVFGGAEQGFVQHDTKVTIKDNCQIGNGYAQMDDDGKYLDELTTPISHISLNRRYSDAEWEAGHLITVDSDPAALKTLALTHYQSSLPECASWKYKSPYAAHDKYANESGYDSKGGAVTATNGHTFYGIVFGGGSGYFPYAPGEWHWKAGNVGGNTLVEIKGGHILTNVYGGNEMTSVKGKCTVNMSGGTIGVPRTLGQIAAHPVTCYLFGGGKGDPRVLFNKQTNVNDVEVNISGGWVYGSVFGGGEDGHVLGNVTMNIQDSEDNTDPENPVITSSPKIGTWGTSYVDGNVFGGGRGFAGDAYTAGNVAGSVTMNISGGTMLGSVYGGGRLGSVGYGLYEATETDKYGTMRPDNLADDGITPVANFKRGYVTINITGGTIGNTREFIVPQASNIPTGLNADFKNWSAEDWTTWKHHNHVPNTTYDTSNGRVLHTKGGNVYAGGMGRYYQLDGETPISAVNWWKLGNVKSTNLTISGENTWIMGNVYGGGELGAVVPFTDNTNPQNPVVQGGTTTISITGGTIGTEITGSTPVKATVPVPNEGISNVKYTYGSVYGGGEGQETHDANERHGGEVSGNTTVGISGDTKVRASVYGGGELAIVGGDTHVTVSGGEIGRNEVQPKGSSNPGYVMFGSATMGNVYGGGKGNLGHYHTGQVKGNTNVSITGGNVYHMVYGGGALGSVGDFKISDGAGNPSYIPIAGIPYDWKYTDGTVIDPANPDAEKTPTGTATVTITGGTIGISGRDNGLVFGSSRGGLLEPYDIPDDGTTDKLDPYDRVAWVNKTVVNIGTEGSGTDYTTPLIKGSVYGGGENGHNYSNATLNVYSGTIGIANKIPGTETPDPWWTVGDDDLDKKYRANRGNVYGAGSGSDTYTGDDGMQHYNPKTGMVGGSTTVNIRGGHIGRSVYGAGAMASVGNITNGADTTDVTKAKHFDEKTGFALSWPYKFVFAPNTGKATINVTGGHIGTKDIDGGDVFGGARGKAGDRYATSHLAYVYETEVNIDYPETPAVSAIPNIFDDFSIPCVTGSVSGSGEDGFVYGDTHVTLNKGLIGHSLYGGGKGKGTYKQKLLKIGATENSTNSDDYYEADIYSLIAGKVFGNTYVTMNDGYVGRNVYGGGNMASVGKGSFASGTDDYAYDSEIGKIYGYGEKLTGNLWDDVSENSKAFLSSGKTTVKVFGGTVGYIAEDPTVSMKNNLPYGNVFGGSAGEAAPEIAEYPRYLYSPAFFSGYVNETDVNIGGYECTTAFTHNEKNYAVGDRMTFGELQTALDGSSYFVNGKPSTNHWKVIGPTKIYSSVYGGGQDGHVRRDTKVTVIGGEIGIPYNATYISLLNTDNLDDPQWVNRGNIYGGGSGITKYQYDFNYDGKIDDTVEGITYLGEPVKEEDYSSSSGSVTRFTEVNILGGIIHRNVYGGGSMGAVGAPYMGQPYDLYKPGQANIADIPENGPGRQSMNLVNIRGTVGTPEDYKVFYGGEVYGASRGLSSLNANQFSTSIWTQVNVLNGAKIMGSVFGGGDSGLVKKDADVIIGDE